MKKTVLIITIFLLAFSPLLGVKRAYGFNNSHWFHVDVSPPNAGVRAAYHIYGGISDYNGIDALTIYLQWTGHKFNHPAPSAIVVNSVPAASVYMSDVPDRSTSRNNLKIGVVLNKKINKGETIDIKIGKEAGVINPSEPRPCYQVSVYLIRNGVEIGYIGSEQYEITQSIVSTPKITVEPAIKGMNAEYTISFVTGVNGNLRAGDDIRIKFPAGTIIPANPFSKYIYMNGKTITNGVYRDSSDPNILRIYLSTGLDASTPVTIQIKKGLGIINPSKPGKYALYISTYKEPEWVKSKPYEIASPSVQNLEVKLNSDIVSTYASVHLSFNTSPVGHLKKGDYVYIDFSPYFSLPSFVDSTLVTFNGVNTEAKIQGNRIAIVVPIPVLNLEKVDIEISDKARIKNPSQSGEYKISVSTDSDDVSAVYSVTIKPSVLGQVKFSALYTGVGISSDYEISFITGAAGDLKNGEDTVNIEFGKGFKIPEQASPADVLINKVPVNNVSIDVYTVIITVPVDIESNSPVTVEIKEDFGIKNPEQVGKYTVKVSTSKEKTEVESNSIDFTELPVVNFSISPKEPDGANEIYRTKPTVQLFTPNGKDIYYAIDDGKFALYGGQSIVMPEGVHKLFAYAIDSKGNKGIVEEKDFTVDNTPPSVIFDEGEGNLYVNTTHPTITGKVSEPCVLQINGVPAAVNSDLAFSVQLDVTNGAPLAIYARDLAGNSVSIVKTVYVDTAPPIITLISPDKSEFFTTESNFVVKVSLNEKGEVTLNGTNMDFENGVFTELVQLSKGENNFTIVARDIAGNEAVKEMKINLTDQIIIKLQIGNDKAYIGGQETGLDSPPVIENNRTLVPLRFILEAFGARINWDGALKVITIITEDHTVQLQIGSNIALIDGSDVEKLSVPPVIKDNRTLVPLRFIAETFGAEVNWDGKTKSIEIAYMPMP
ncbi:MAG: copper amine oxidase N-terminal domain-containing protein [Caldisericaceae bacterium]|nr:copper amine oxidase N-terminal domain-containing protein [Caldisericaceae bacterium]